MLEPALIIALTTLFIHACTWEGMIFSFVPELFWNAPVWLKKPLYDCPACMCPWWGSVILSGFGYVSGDWPRWYAWLLILAMAGGVNVIASALITEEIINNGSGNT